MTDATEKAEQVPGEQPEQAEATADTGDAELEELRAELEKAQALADENNSKYIRLAAEIDNLRKRTTREIEQARKFGVERFVNELLAVVDSLEMGIDAGVSASAEALLEGKQATLKLLQAAMEKSGVEVVDPEGEPFDPNLHEAMTMQLSEDAEPGSIIAVVQKGYQLNGRLLRPARVVVASDPED